MENKKNIKKYNGLTKLSDNEKQYKKPLETVAEKLSSEDIVNLLINYQEVKFENLKIGIHTRYYKKNKDDSLDFKLGGTLLKVNKLEKYCVLMSNGMTWTAQENSIFYQEMNNTDKIKELETQIEKDKSQINELISYIKQLEINYKKQIETLQNKNKSLESTIKKLKK